MRDNEEKKIYQKIYMYRSRIVYYKEKINICNEELLKIEEEKVIKNTDKAFFIIGIIRKRYSLKENYHSLLFRQHEIVDMIYKVMKLVDNNTTLSMKILESIFNKDRSTVTHALKTVDNFIETDKKYKDEYELILSEHNLKYSKYKPRKTGRKVKINIDVLK